jgi:hypothetical protein
LLAGSFAAIREDLAVFVLVVVVSIRRLHRVSRRIGCRCALRVGGVPVRVDHLTVDLAACVGHQDQVQERERLGHETEHRDRRETRTS